MDLTSVGGELVEKAYSTKQLFWAFQFSSVVLWASFLKLEH